MESRTTRDTRQDTRRELSRRLTANRSAISIRTFPVYPCRTHRTASTVQRRHFILPARRNRRTKRSSRRRKWKRVAKCRLTIEITDFSKETKFRNWFLPSNSLERLPETHKSARKLFKFLKLQFVAFQKQFCLNKKFNCARAPNHMMCLMICKYIRDRSPKNFNEKHFCQQHLCHLIWNINESFTEELSHV